MSKALSYLKILLFVLWSLPLVAAQSILMPFHLGPISYKIPRLWHWGLCRVFGMRVRIVGTPLPTTKPVMFISNHISYLDILVMGSKIEASFVAKNDVAKWPVFGFLANLQQTAYISRASRDALKEKHSLQSYLKAGKSIILFPEGTTNNGKTILPFKSSLFVLALEHHLTDGQLMIQPFSIRVSAKSGKTGQVDAQNYSWAFDDDTPIGAHLMRFARGHGCILELVFHTPVDPKQYNDRKTLCRVIETMVTNGHRDGTVQPVPIIEPDLTPPLEKELTL